MPPTKEAMKLLIAAAEGDFRVKLIFAAMTGVRASEFHALRWHHIDFDKAEVTSEALPARHCQEFRRVPLTAIRLVRNLWQPGLLAP